MTPNWVGRYRNERSTLAAGVGIAVLGGEENPAGGKVVDEACA